MCLSVASEANRSATVSVDLRPGHIYTDPIQLNSLVEFSLYICDRG